MKFTLKPFGIAPRRGTADSAGFDLFAPEDLYVPFDTQVTVDTGVIVDLGDLGNSYDITIQPRSSSSKRGISLANTIGLIDYDYRGPDDTIKVVVKNATQGAIRTSKVIGKSLKNEPIPENVRQVLSQIILNNTAEISRFDNGDEVIWSLIEEIPTFDGTVFIKKGEAFAQMVVRQHVHQDLIYVSPDEWQTSNSRGGFGSTDKK